VLTGAAKAWIVDEPLSKADAIVVLGGGVENRPFAAARFYHQGLAPKILFMDVRLNPTTRLGLIPPEADLTRQVLLKLEVPESDMVAIGDKVASTYDESRAVRAWVEKSGAKTLIIPDDLFHTRRVRWLFRKQLKGTGARALVSAVAPALDQYEATNWWQHEEGLIAFQNEVVKLMYYHLKY
jgi:uncharacterized SAM-binding protein YcdF (DUF218 family)